MAITAQSNDDCNHDGNGDGNVDIYNGNSAGNDDNCNNCDVIMYREG